MRYTVKLKDSVASLRPYLEGDEKLENVTITESFQEAHSLMNDHWVARGWEPQDLLTDEVLKKIE